MDKEKKRDEKINIEVTIPTKDTIIKSIQDMFPTVDVKIVQEEEEPDDAVRQLIEKERAEDE